MSRENKAKAQEARAKVILAEAEIPACDSRSVPEQNIGIMDYYRLQNVQADTQMRESMAKAREKIANAIPFDKGIPLRHGIPLSLLVLCLPARPFR